MKLAILTTATCLFGFCIGGEAEPPKTKQASPPTSSFEMMSEEALQASTLYKSDFRPSGKFGSYLSAHFAQRRFDWNSAHKYMHDVLSGGDEALGIDSDIKRRAMLLAVGAGEMEEAITLSKELLAENETQDSLAVIVAIVDALKQNDLNAVREKMAAMEDDGLSRFIKPLLQAWLDAEKGSLSVTDLTGLSIFNHQAVLLADYLDKPETMRELLQSAMQNRNLKILDLENIADAYTHIGDYDKAEKLYSGILDFTPEYRRAQDKLAAVIQGEKPDYFKPATSIQTGIELAFYDLARLLYAQSSDETAQFLVQLTRYIDPDNVNADILLASMAANNARYEDALSIYATIPEGHEKYLDVQREMANILEDAGRYSEAIAVLEKLGAQYGDIESVIQIGDIHRRLEDFEAAIESYKRAETMIGGEGIPEKYWHLHYVLGMAYERAGQWSNAQRELEAALQYRPENPYVLNYLGYAWADQGTNLNKAKDMILKAVNLRPYDGYITDSLGWVLYRMGQYEEAVFYLEKAVALLPYDPVINDHLGDAYWKVGRRIEARFQWERARNHADDDDSKLLAFIEEKLESGLTESIMIKQAGAQFEDDMTRQTP